MLQSFVRLRFVDHNMVEALASFVTSLWAFLEAVGARGVSRIAAGALKPQFVGGKLVFYRVFWYFHQQKMLQFCLKMVLVSQLDFDPLTDDFAQFWTWANGSATDPAEPSSTQQNRALSVGAVRAVKRSGMCGWVG